MAGAYFNIAGANGWPATLSSIYSIRVSTPTGLVPTNIVSCCTNGNVVIELPAVSVNTTFTLTFTGPVNTITKTATLSANPSVTLTTPMPLTPGINSLSLTSSGAISAVKVVSKADC